jgi:WD40 repeat protein
VNRFLCLLLVSTLPAAITPLLAAPATALAFSPDSSLLAVGAYRRIELRSLGDRKSTEGITCELSRICSIAFSSNSSFLVIAGGSPGESGAALLLSGKDKAVQQRFTNFADLVTGTAFSSDETWIAAAGADSSAMLFPLTPKKTQTPISLRGHSGPVLSIGWSPQDDIVVTASADRSIKVWSAVDGHLLRSLGHHTEPVHTIAFRSRIGSADAAPVECASGSDDGTVRIWQPKIGRMVRIIRGHGGPIFSLVYTVDGNSLFSAGKEGIIRRLDAESDRILGQWQADEEPIYRLAVSPDGKYLASGDWSGQVHLWKISGEQLLRQ